MSPSANLSSKPRKRLSSEARKEALLDVAAELISENGVDALTMEGIAERAGVSKALGYRYFSNRDDVLLALFQREQLAFDTALTERLEKAATFEDRLRAILVTFLDRFKEKGSLVATLQFANLGSGPAEKERVAQAKNGREAIARLIQNEYGLPRDLALGASSVLVTGVLGILQLWADRVVPRRILEDEFVTLAIGGLERLASQHRDGLR